MGMIMTKKMMDINGHDGSKVYEVPCTLFVILCDDVMMRCLISCTRVMMHHRKALPCIHVVTGTCAPLHSRGDNIQVHH